MSKDRSWPPWQAPGTAPKGVTVLVQGPFGIAAAQYDLGRFRAMAGKLEVYTEEGDLLMLEGVTGWMLMPSLEP